MTIVTVARRLEKIEGRSQTGCITSICNLGAYPDEVAAEAIRDRGTWSADGRIRRRGDTLVLLPPVLAAAEWTGGNALDAGRLQ